MSVYLFDRTYAGNGLSHWGMALQIAFEDSFCAQNCHPGRFDGALWNELQHDALVFVHCINSTPWVNAAQEAIQQDPPDSRHIVFVRSEGGRTLTGADYPETIHECRWTPDQFSAGRGRAFARALSQGKDWNCLDTLLSRYDLGILSDCVVLGQVTPEIELEYRKLRDRLLFMQQFRMELAGRVFPEWPLGNEANQLAAVRDLANLAERYHV